jgi:hypothetical protein
MLAKTKNNRSIAISWHIYPFLAVHEMGNFTQKWYGTFWVNN